MKGKLADFILKACDNCNTFFKWEEQLPEIREGYMGRWHSAPTTAIIVRSLPAVMAAIAVECLEIEAETDDPEELVDVSEIRHLKIDSIGSRIVIY
jgi:hypothetical protein